ncbi:MAG TPA: hypothetical protein VL048_03785 [Xanthobacteraceae bacterium]|nr:hypothetical protein [Xanthobacteraceae bacterium]
MDKSTKGITARLRGRQHAFVPGHPGAIKSRAVVAAHAGAQSVNTDAGKKPCAHDCNGPNAAANAAYNQQAQHASRPAGSATPGQIVGSGIKLN